MNYTIHKNFLEEDEQQEVIAYVNGIKENIVLEDHHLKHLIGKINGNSYMYDISKSSLTQVITSYQSGGHVISNKLPAIFDDLIHKIAKVKNFPKDHVFLQIVDMNSGGIIGRHYDASLEGYVNYKCNISVLSEDYGFCIDNEVLEVNERDLYCFEASLYKHWTLKPYTSRRILLSFGFLLPYGLLERDENDPRVRLSKRIQKYFQT